MSESTPASRVRIDGKFFRLGPRKFHPRGTSYGPFTPNPQTGSFPSRAQILIDFDLLQQLGANLIRVYEVPPPWFLDLALAHDLRVLVDVPWSSNLCFLDRPDQERAAVEAVRQAARSCAGHVAVFGYSVVNELPSDIVRWHGQRRIERFLNRLADVAHEHDPGCLVTFASFPPSEYLDCSAADFCCFNVFLENRKAYEAYLARLQVLAGPRPLLLGECGMDSLRDGELRQAEVLSWQVECAFRAGLAGVVVFSFTDDWHRGGRPVEGWAFGLTTRDRGPKEAFRAVQRQFRSGPYPRLTRLPRVSVVVACYNGERTLKACLDALSELNYPDYEVILVDDGSTDSTSQIAQGYPALRRVHQPHCGLSVARNTGIVASTGEIVAFTDADCRPDQDWLYYIVQELLVERAAAAGGPNYLPGDDSQVAAAVMASPGGPTQVLLTDREAEHIPGCNLALWKWALREVDGFDPIFERAGDDVDVCWRLLQRGWKIRFSGAAFVWHYRRSTLRSYFAQQFGYGEAEALLAAKHPEYFNALGGGHWRGKVYDAGGRSASVGRSAIYRGAFGTALFQRVYEASPHVLQSVSTSLEYYSLVTLPLLVLGVVWHRLLPLVAISLGVSIIAAVVAAARAEISKTKQTFWSRPLVAVLYLVQPLVRGWARYRWRFVARSVRPTTFRRTAAGPTRWLERPSLTLSFFSEHGVQRIELLQRLLQDLRREGWEHRVDTGWTSSDLEIWGRRWTRLRLATVTEELGQGQRIIRCRLRAEWSLPARWALAVLAAVAWMLTMTWDQVRPWIWFAWVALPAFGAWVEAERRVTLQLVAALVNEVSKQLSLQHLLSPESPAGEVRRAVQPPKRDERDELEELL